MINDIRNIVNFVLNKESRGYITPLQFNTFAKQAQQEIIDSYYFEYNRLKTGRERRINYNELVTKAREAIDSFIVPPTALTYSAGSFVVPADLYKAENLIYNGTTEIEQIERERLMYHVSDDFSGSSVFYPTYIRYEGSYVVYPLTIVSGVSLSYFRLPKDPNWTYQLIGDDPIFNPSGVGYQDFEVGYEDKMKLIVKILKYCGINIREAEIVQAATILEQSTDNEKRT